MAAVMNDLENAHISFVIEELLPIRTESIQIICEDQKISTNLGKNFLHCSTLSKVNIQYPNNMAALSPVRN